MLWTAATWSTSSVKLTNSSSNMRSLLPPLAGSAIGTGTVSVLCIARGGSVIMNCAQIETVGVLLSSCLTHEWIPFYHTVVFIISSFEKYIGVIWCQQNVRNCYNGQLVRCNPCAHVHVEFVVCFVKMCLFLVFKTCLLSVHFMDLLYKT